ncbi:hypothetical protein HK405_011034, partial [Cladochytrium tenue]
QGIRRTLASLGHNDGKNLNIYIQEEKDVIQAMQGLVKERREALQYFDVWGKLEAPDIKDIAEKMVAMMNTLVEAEAQLVQVHVAFVEKFRGIQEREAAIHELRHKARRAAEALERAVKHQKPSEQLEFERQFADEEVRKAEAEHVGLLRVDVRDATAVYFAGYADLAFRMTAMAKFGKHLSDQVPQGTLRPGEELPPYTGGKVVEQIYRDFRLSLQGKIPLSPLVPPASPQQRPASTHRGSSPAVSLRKAASHNSIASQPYQTTQSSPPSPLPPATVPVPVGLAVSGLHQQQGLSSSPPSPYVISGAAAQAVAASPPSPYPYQPTATHIPGAFPNPVASASPPLAGAIPLTAYVLPDGQTAYFAAGSPVAATATPPPPHVFDGASLAGLPEAVYPTVPAVVPAGATAPSMLVYTTPDGQQVLVPAAAAAAAVPLQRRPSPTAYGAQPLEPTTGWYQPHTPLGVSSHSTTPLPQPPPPPPQAQYASPSPSPHPVPAPYAAAAPPAVPDHDEHRGRAHDATAAHPSRIPVRAPSPLPPIPVDVAPGPASASSSSGGIDTSHLHAEAAGGGASDAPGMARTRSKRSSAFWNVAEWGKHK